MKIYIDILLVTNAIGDAYHAGSGRQDMSQGHKSAAAVDSLLGGRTFRRLLWL